MSLDPERQIELQWAIDTEELYPVRIQIIAHDSIGLLANITGAISESKVNILDASTKTGTDSKAEGYFTISVSGAKQLEKVIKAVRKIKSVISVKRVEG